MVESVSILVPKCQVSFLYCLRMLIFSVYFFNVETGQSHTLVHYQDLVSIRNIRISLAVPKDLWITLDIESFDLLVRIEVP